MLPDDLYTYAGHLGVVFYLGSYAALQAGLIRGSSVTYTLLNMAAAGLVLLSMAVAFNLSAALIQISWIVISVIGLIRMAVQKGLTRFDERERAMIDAAFPDMPRPMARRLLNAGLWQDAPDGTLLATEAEPVEALHIIADGRAEVIAGGRRVATLDHGFVGEMNVIDAGPASASVRTLGRATVFTLSGPVLRRLRDRDPDMRTLLDAALTRDTAAKLKRANHALSERSKRA